MLKLGTLIYGANMMMHDFTIAIIKKLIKIKVTVFNLDQSENIEL